MKQYLKKVLTIFSMLVLTLCFVAGCSCGQKKIESIEIKDGTLKFIYLKDDEVDFSDLKVIVKYNDGTNNEVGKDKLEISEFSTAVVGKYKVTIKYEKEKIEVELTVTNDPDATYSLTGFEQATSYVQHLANKNYVGTDEAEKESQFKVQDRGYVVGDDNAFIYFPNITAFDDDNQPVEDIYSFRSISKVYLKDGTNYTLLEGEDLTNVVTIDDTKFSYDFSEAAIGNTYKIEVRPYYLSETQLLEVEEWTKSIEVTVVDGYNVTSAVELGLMVNVNARDSKDYLSAWNALFASKNIAKPSSLKGLVLHNNLTIKVEDIPSAYFEEINGVTYLVDYADIYTIGLNPNSEFTFYGNYFTIDASEIPLIDRENADGKTSHASLFKTRLVNDPTCNDDITTSCATTVPNTKFTMRDVLLKGNVNRENNENGFAGLMMGKFQTVTNTLDNVIIKTFFINTYADQEKQGTGSSLTLKNVKSYDAYQNLLMGWGAENISIINSELKRAGGPAMLFMHPHPEENTDSYFANVTVDESSVIESYVQGTEAWFTATGSSDVATQITAINTGIFANLGKTFVHDGKMNIVSVFMPAAGSLTDITTKDVQGKLVINGVTVLNKNNEGGNDLYSVINNDTYINAPIFTTTAGGIAMYTGNQSMPLVNPKGGEVDYTNLAQGDILTLYMQGMGIVIGDYASIAQ